MSKSGNGRRDVSLRDVMRTFPQGVVVVTADDVDGPRGITVSSFLSISLTPPLVLISIQKDARAHPAIERGSFLINVLGEHQGAVSDHFAMPNLSSHDQFEKYGRKGEVGGLRAVEDCLAYLHCKVVGRIDQADHTLFIGEVEQAELGNEARPLVFYSRRYWRLGSTAYERD